MQYILLFIALLVVINLSSSIEGLVSWVGSVGVLAIISWFLSQRVRKHFNREILTSYERAVIITGLRIDTKIE